MDIVEYAETLLGYPLPQWQKDFLLKLQEHKDNGKPFVMNMYKGPASTQYIKWCEMNYELRKILIDLENKKGE